MEEYFVQKCVTADEPPAPLGAVSAWSAAHRCECVMVREGAHASGASRAVLASIVDMTTASKKTRRVVLVTLEPALAAAAATAPEKLVRIDFSSDWSWLDAGLADGSQSELLTKIQNQLDSVLNSSNTNEADSSSARPNVVVIDALNVLVETYPRARVLAWLRSLRCDPRIGAVVFRLNASALIPRETPASAVEQSLARETTAVVQVETPASLRAYPVLAKERRREIPRRMHGLVLLLRKKKNGRTSESVEFFQVSNGRVVYTSNSGDVPTANNSGVAPSKTTSASKLAGTESSRAPPGTQLPQQGTTIGSGKALPVSADEISFNLSISAEEEAAKRSVELPYMHQGDAVNNLLFIDEDDPDWDDDDLDDDLDI